MNEMSAFVTDSTVMALIAIGIGGIEICVGRRQIEP